jgi:sulfite reductase (NADPH) flavoprotein alpha-component
LNALAPPVPLIPETAPFTPAQRAWLNGFLAGFYGEADPPAMSKLSDAEPEDLPWHDPSLELGERLALAEGKTLPRRLMAAMAQLDCGQCGYLCQTYGEALADGRETSTSLCVPRRRRWWPLRRRPCRPKSRFARFVSCLPSD